MLGTYVFVIGALIIMVVAGVGRAYYGDLDEQIKKPFKEAIKLFNDKPTDNVGETYKKVWNEVQKEVSNYYSYFHNC